MSTVSLNSNQISNVTVVSNYFIDYYMPAANGSYVKVYLYLLRCLYMSDFDISISIIADSLEDSEKDIIRALNYWEKAGVISLVRDNRSEITGIHMNNLEKPDILEHNLKNNAIISDSPSEVLHSEVLQSINITDSELAAVSAPKPPIHINTGISKPTYTQAQINELTNHDEIKWLLSVLEIYMERLLKPTDLQLILYLYESIGFSAELILYLYEYCISKGKKNCSYIEAVALSWAEEGIDTVQKAEASADKYNFIYNSIKKAFGINREIGSIERQYINKWSNKYEFDINIIIEACNRTILATQKPDFKYADKILSNWKNKNVRHLSDINQLDAEHKNQQKHHHGIQSKSTSNTNSTNNKFNAFPQRNYSKEDYNNLEQKLLRK